MPDFNPYAAPKSELPPNANLRVSADETGVWQEGKLLVMSKNAELPDRCVKCNLPAHGYRLKRNLSWHPPAWALLVLISPLLYIIVALIIRKTALIHVGLCEEHRSRRSRAILVCWLSILAAIALMIGGPSLDTSPDKAAGMIVLFLGIAVLLFGIIYGVVGAQVAPPKKIDKQFVWLTKVNPAYLAELPVLLN